MVIKDSAFALNKLNEITSAALLPLFVPLRPRNSEMEISKIIAIVIASSYVLAFICVFAFDEERDAEWEESLFRGATGLLFWLVLCQ